MKFNSTAVFLMIIIFIGTIAFGFYSQVTGLDCKDTREFFVFIGMLIGGIAGYLVGKSKSKK